MSNQLTDRFTYTEKLLREHFGEDFIALHDDSEAHLGHAGAESGASHYELILSHQSLVHYGSLIKLHRAVYQVVGHLIPLEIHALKIEVK